MSIHMDRTGQSLNCPSDHFNQVTFININTMGLTQVSGKA